MELPQGLFGCLTNKRTFKQREDGERSRQMVPQLCGAKTGNPNIGGRPPAGCGHSACAVWVNAGPASAAASSQNAQDTPSFLRPMRCHVSGVTCRVNVPGVSSPQTRSPVLCAAQRTVGSAGPQLPGAESPPEKAGHTPQLLEEVAREHPGTHPGSLTRTQQGPCPGVCSPRCPEPSSRRVSQKPTLPEVSVSPSGHSGDLLPLGAG